MATQLRALNGLGDAASLFSTLVEAGKQEQQDALAQIVPMQATLLYPSAPSVSTGAPTSTPGQTAQQNTTPSTTVTTTAPAKTSWYKTWWGIGLLAIGGVGAYKAFKK